MSQAQAPLTPEQIAANALNEQGYLFQHKIATVLLEHERGKKLRHRWQVETTELPVALPSGDETRLDLVLRLGADNATPVRAVVECKRAAREYKRWIFFAQNEIAHNPSPSIYYSEKAHLRSTYKGKGEPDIIHDLESKPATSECPVFDFGVEARLNRPNSGQRVSATNAIEEAFQQVTLGQAGLGIRLRRQRVYNFRILPVVATTAELVSAHFDADRVALGRGEVPSNDINIRSRKWVAVNFRIREAVTLCVPMGLHDKIPLAAELTLRRVRTVFVVQAEYIHEFLTWLGQMFPSATG